MFSGQKNVENNFESLKKIPQGMINNPRITTKILGSITLHLGTGFFLGGKSLHFFCPKAFPSRLVESLSTFLEKIGRNAWGIPLFLLNPNKLKGSNRCLFINFSWSWVTAPPYWWKAYGCRWGNPVEAEDS